MTPPPESRDLSRDACERGQILLVLFHGFLEIEDEHQETCQNRCDRGRWYVPTSPGRHPIKKPKPAVPCPLVRLVWTGPGDGPVSLYMPVIHWRAGGRGFARTRLKLQPRATISTRSRARSLFHRSRTTYHIAPPQARSGTPFARVSPPAPCSGRTSRSSCTCWTFRPPPGRSRASAWS